MKLTEKTGLSLLRGIIYTEMGIAGFLIAYAISILVSTPQPRYVTNCYQYVIYDEPAENVVRETRIPDMDVCKRERVN